MIMKPYSCLVLINILLLGNPIISHERFYPNLPFGEYRVIIRGYMNCNRTATYDIAFNTRLSKKSASTIEVLGNITLKVPFDDSFSLNLNMAVKDLIGGWKDNAHILKMPNGCTALKTILNTLWLPFTNAFGMKSNCPIPPGIYVSKGFDLSNIMSEMTGSNVFFYGSYKTRLFFTDKHNKERGCIIIFFDMKRPWEKE